MQHTYHTPYPDKSLSPEVSEFVSRRLSNSIAADIYHELSKTNIPGADVVKEHQVYYLWTRHNSDKRKLDKDLVELPHTLKDPDIVVL